MRQLARFAAVGVTNTVVTLAAYAIAVRLGVPYLPAGAIAYGLGGINGFTLNRQWTFGRSGRPIRYAAVVALGIGANLALLHMAVAAGVPRLAAQLAVIAPVTLVTFALTRSWAFAEHDPPFPPPVLDARRALRGVRRAGAGRPDRPAPAGDSG